MNGSSTLFPPCDSNAQLLSKSRGNGKTSESSSIPLSDTVGQDHYNKSSKCRLPRGENLLILLTVIGVVLGICIGVGVKHLEPSKDAIILINFPGEMLMRMLKMLIIPIIVSSIVTGLANLDVKSSGKMGFHAILYYMCTTASAVVLGIILVTCIKPGNQDYNKSEIKAHDINTAPVSTMDTFLDLIRNLFPENIVAAMFEVVRTSTEKVAYEANALVNNTNGTELNETVTLFRLEKSKSYSHSTNVLGVIVFFVFFGIMLSSLGEEGKPVVKIFSIFNDIFMKMIKIVIWYSPIGICSLIAANLLKLEHVSDLVEILGLYMVTVITGLLIHGLIVLPLIYYVFTRKNPFALYRGVLQAFITAVGTSSSAGTLPVTMNCLEKNLKIDKRVTQFVVPLGATMNMDGTALLEGVAAITIAQMYGMHLTFGNVITISVTATMASIGAAAIPSAGLVTLILVLTSIGLPADAVGILWSVDWILDRLRTGLNVLGDCAGAGIVQHLNQEMLDRHMPILNKDNRRDLDEMKCGKSSFNDPMVADSGFSMEISEEAI